MSVAPGRGAGTRTFIELDGEQVAVADTVWVVWLGDWPTGVMDNTTDIKASTGKAAFAFWGNAPRDAIVDKLNSGFRLELMTRARYHADVWPIMAGGKRIEHEGQTGVFIPDRHQVVS